MDENQEIFAPYLSLCFHHSYRIRYWKLRVISKYIYLVGNELDLFSAKGEEFRPGLNLLARAKFRMENRRQGIRFARNLNYLRKRAEWYVDWNYVSSISVFVSLGRTAPPENSRLEIEQPSPPRIPRIPRIPNLCLRKDRSRFIQPCRDCSIRLGD